MLSAVFAAPVLRGTPAPVLQARLGFARGAEAQKNAPRQSGAFLPANCNALFFFEKQHGDSVLADSDFRF